MKPGCKRSPVWDFFEKSKDKKSVTCVLCKKVFKYFGNTTNMKKHLLRMHPVESIATNFDNNDPSLPQKPNEVSEVDRVGPTASCATSTSKRKMPLDDQVSHPVKRHRQLKLFSTRGTDMSVREKKEIDEKLIKMITIDYQPLSIVENEGFREYTKILNDKYTIPNRKFLTETMIPNKYAESVSNLKQMLDAVKHVAITTDIWTSDCARAYISATTHFIHNDQLCSYNIATREIYGSHTGENIGNVLITILKEWNIFNKVVTMVSDNGSNIKKAINDFVQKIHHPCVAHTLNLSVTEAISSNEILSAVLKKCRALVGHFKHSVLATEKLKNTQLQMKVPVLKVKQDVSTRWNSCLIMMERLLEIKDSLAVVITSLPWAPESLDAAEWFILKDCAAILKPAEVLTTILSGDQYPTISLVIPLIRGLQHSLQNLVVETDCGKLLRSSLSEVVSRRLGCLEQNKIVAKATFLDPTFKKVGFGLEENANNAQKWVTDELANLIDSRKEARRRLALAEAVAVHPPTPTDSTKSDSPVPVTLDRPSSSADIWAFFDNKIDKVKSYTTSTTTALLSVRQYLELPHIERLSNPLEFWKKHKMMFPELYEISSKYLCIPGTSVPSERVFSKAGQLTNIRRNRLAPKNLDKIIFLNTFCR